MSNRAEKNSLDTLLLILGFGFLGIALLLVLFGNRLIEQVGLRPEATGVLDEVQPIRPSTPSATLNAVRPAEAPEVGDLAIAFSLPDIQGNEVSLSDFRGQNVIINFWATWCGPCVFEMPELQAAYEAQRENGVVVLGVNRDEDIELVRTFLQEDLDVEITFPILLDKRAVVSDRYSVYNLPTTYFINGEGVITAVHRGPLTQELIEEYLAERNT